MPEPLLSPDVVEQRLPFSPVESFGIDDTETDADGDTAWDRLLTTVLEEEADRINGWLSVAEQPDDLTDPYDPVTAFEVVSTTQTLDATGGEELPLPGRPVQSVTSITADDTTLTPGEDVYVEDTHLVLATDSAPVDEWPDGRRSVEVTYEYGQDGVPGPVADGFVRLVRNALERIESDGLQQESEGGFSYTYRPPEQLLAEVEASVNDYGPPDYHSGAMVI